MRAGWVPSFARLARDSSKRPQVEDSLPFSGYAGYISTLRDLARNSHNSTDWHTRVTAALDGQASRELRRVAPLETRRKFGAFFTGTELGAKLIQNGGSFEKNHVFYDPTCGMGDLLLAVARKLPLGKTLAETLQQWGQQLTGTDLHREFVNGARTRLLLLALHRHAHLQGGRVEAGREAFRSTYFPYIQVGDGLKRYALFERATHLLLNPPFGKVEAPSDCSWASGHVTEAAHFVIAALERSKPSTQMLAVLPDVLRSGAFSAHWRERVNELAEVLLAEPYGLFDESADVDVFLLHLVRKDAAMDGQTIHWGIEASKGLSTVSDYFNVHVGRVVPHRDPETGPLVPYIHPRGVPTWVIMREFPESRRFDGLLYKPPFVAVRRTSRPGHPYRATATVIAGKEPIAVENHLIVCLPKDGKLVSCRELMSQLKTEGVNDHLNARIRCRHLTTGVVANIPFETVRAGVQP